MEGGKSCKARDTHQTGPPGWPSPLCTDASLCKIDVNISWFHGDVIKWKHFPRYWSFVRGIRQSPVNSPHKGQRRGALMFSLIYAWINDWVNNREAGDLIRHGAHYDVIVMLMPKKVDQQYGCRWHFFVLLRITLILFLLRHQSTNTSNNFLL